MEMILHGGAEQVAAPLGKSRDEKSGGLDVGDGVFARVVGRQESAGLLRGEAGGGESQSESPRQILTEGRGDYTVFCDGGGGHSSEEAGGDIVRMAFAAARSNFPR